MDRTMKGWMWLAAAAAALIACKSDDKPVAGGRCEPGQAVCGDDKTQLACDDGTWRAYPCRGAKGCYKRGEGLLLCDHDVAQAGDACRPRGMEVAGCSPDKRAVMRCVDGKFEVSEPCKGRGGCARDFSVEGSTFQLTMNCDHSVADVGDACSEPGDQGCSTDRKRLVQCRGGRFEEQRACRGPKGCYELGTLDFRCDTGSGAPAE